jgi:hypothetical protein
MVQLLVMARELPQVFELIAYSLGFMPPSDALEKVSSALPVFVTVTGIATAVVFTSVMGKVTAVVENDAMGAPPLPLSVAVCGLLTALSETLNRALKLATEAGVKVTVMVHVAAAARVVPHVLDSAKSASPAPVILMPVIVRVLFPVLDSVADMPVAVVPTSVFGNARDAVERTAPTVGVTDVLELPPQPVSARRRQDIVNRTDRRMLFSYRRRYQTVQITVP